MAGNLKGNYDAIGFAFKKCQFNFVPKAEQVQVIHAVVTGNDVKHKSVCYVVPFVCDFLRSVFDGSQSVLRIVTPLK